MFPALLLAAITASPPPVFGAGIEKVYVDAFVTRGGHAVPRLREEDFELRDDGVPQKVEVLALEQAPVSLFLALDTSGSVAGEMLSALRAAAHALVGGLPRWDHVGLLSFNARLVLRAAPSADRAAVDRAIDRLEAGGGTALHDAIYAGMRLSAPDERRVVVVFSDGADNRSWLSAEAVREASRRTGALVYAVCRTSEADETPPPAFGGGTPPERESGFARELRLLAESTGGLFLAGGDPRTVNARFQHVIADLSTRYLLAFVPSVRREGEHRIEVKVRSGKGRVRHRRGYVVPPSPSASAPRSPVR
jgi:VWFA-related protein